MNPAIMAAIHASQKGTHSVDDLVGRLKKAKALSVSSAISLPDYDQAKIDEALGLGLVILSANGRLHLNERAASDRNQSHVWILLVVVLVAASIIASGIALVSS